MKKICCKIVWSLLFLLLVAGELQEFGQNCDDDIKVQHLHEFEGIKRKHSLKTGPMTTRSKIRKDLTHTPEEASEVTVLLEGVNGLNANYQKSTKVLQVLQKVSFSKCTTLVLFGSTERIDYKNVFIDHPVPVLILNPQVNWPIIRQFNSNIFSIVFLIAEYSLEDPLFVALKQILYGLRSKKILIIKESLIGEVDNQLLQWFYVNEFWETFLMDFEGNSMSMQAQKLSLEEFLQSDIKWSNLQGVVISSYVSFIPPRSFVEYDEHKNTILKGFFGSIITLFAQRYKATLKTVLLPNDEMMSCKYYIYSEELDMCSQGLPYGEEYLITAPVDLTKSYIMVPHDKPLARFFYFLKPFQENVWRMLIFSFLFKIIALSFIHRLQHGSWESSLQMLYAVVSTLYLPFQLRHVRSPYRGFLEIVMISVGFVVDTWYLSVLSSLLFTRLYSHDVNSFEDLRARNISIMVDEYMFPRLSTSEIYPIVRQQVKLVPHDMLLQHLRDLDPRYAFFLQNDVIKFYRYQESFLLRPRTKVLKTPVTITVGGIAVRKNWPYFCLLNQFYKRLVESGIYEHIYTDSLAGGVKSGYLKFFPTEFYYVETLSAEYFQMPAMLLAVGYLLSLMAFLFELLLFQIYYRRRT